MAAVLVLLLASCSKDKEQAPDYEATPVDRQKLLDLVNEVRTSGCNCGTVYFPPVDSVVWNQLLEQAAINHSGDLFLHDTLMHLGSNGSTPRMRMEAVGYVPTYWGENIASGYQTEVNAMAAWLKSEGHCKSIMKGAYKEMGVGRVGNFWTQLLTDR